jgi:hypothetical protein
MTVKEFKELIKESKNRETFDGLNSSVHFEACNFHQEFQDAEKLFAFLLKESNAWKKELNENNVTELEYSYNWFYDKKERLVSLVKSSHIYDYDIDRYINELNRSEDVLTAKSPETQFLIELWKLNPECLEGALFYITGKLEQIHWTDNSDLIAGVLEAHEFTSQGFPILANRGEVEQKEFHQLRADFQREIDEANESRSVLFEELKQSKQEFESTIKRIQLNYEEEFKEWLVTHQEIGTSHHEDSVAQINELKSTYANLLMLKEPAEYWDKRAADLKRSANTWFWLAGASALGGLILFIVLAYSLSLENFYKHIQNPAISIRWSILSIVSILLIVFLVRTFVKLAMSTYHLYRDAQERKQLTYLYLSLKKESDIPDADRHIILQSLFSRADTGLLKEDSSPTMPSGVLDKIVSK